MSRHISLCSLAPLLLLVSDVAAAESPNRVTQVEGADIVMQSFPQEF